MWEDGKMVEDVDGWACQIVDLDESDEILAVVDSCGNLGIFTP